MTNARATALEHAAHRADSENPWIGLESFTEETRAYFFGREEEIGELVRRIERKLLTVFFGQSGLGKTSILNAGISPRLRESGYLPIYVRIDYSPEAPPPAQQVRRALLSAAENGLHWTQGHAAAQFESIWEFLHSRDNVLRDRSGRAVTPVLIFDQFEEIFTIAQSDSAGRARAQNFVETLADLVENRAPSALEAQIEADEGFSDNFDYSRADYRVLIALREDYLAHLESLKSVMPSITQNRLRLSKMTSEQALSAVINPGPNLVTKDAATAIVRFVSGGAYPQGAEVEPSLLSLVCHELNNTRIARGGTEISIDLLEGSNESILTGFYDRTLADQPAGVRNTIEDMLLTDSGYRESLAEERIAKALSAFGDAPDILAKLVNRRLLRIEERLDVRRVELTHDVLCGVVRSSREQRLAREAREAAERQLEAQRTRSRATRRALKRTQAIALASAALALVAVGGAIFGYVNLEKAKAAQADTQRAQLLTDHARAQAEDLVSFLLEDLRLEFEPFGRLDSLAKLLRRSIDYYDALPAELRTTGSEKNHAFAELRYARTLLALGFTTQAVTTANDAKSILERLAEAGLRDEMVTLGLAIGDAVLSSVSRQMGRGADALSLARRAHESALSLARRQEAPASMRREVAVISSGYAVEELRHRNYVEANRIFDISTRLLRGLMENDNSDSRSMVHLIDTIAWQVLSIEKTEGQAKAMEVAKEGIRIADAILKERPNHLQVLRTRALLLSRTGAVLSQARDARGALQWYKDAVQAYARLLTLDPGSVAISNNYGVALSRAASASERLGSVRDALQFRLSASDLWASVLSSGDGSVFRLVNAESNSAEMIRLAAELGDTDALRTANEIASVLSVRVAGATTGQGFWQGWFPARRKKSAAYSAFLSGKFPLAFEEAILAAEAFLALPADTSDVRRRGRSNASQSYWIAARAAFAMADFSRTESAIRQALQLSVEEDEQDTSISKVNHLALLSMALTMLGQPDEARTNLAEAQRIFEEVASEQEKTAPSLTRSRLVAAHALANQSRARLTEALRMLDQLPGDYVRSKSTKIFGQSLQQLLRGI